LVRRNSRAFLHAFVKLVALVAPSATWTEETVREIAELSVWLRASLVNRLRLSVRTRELSRGHTIALPPEMDSGNQRGDAGSRLPVELQQRLYRPEIDPGLPDGRALARKVVFAPEHPESDAVAAAQCLLTAAVSPTVIAARQLQSPRSIGQRHDHGGCRPENTFRYPFLRRFGRVSGIRCRNT
jgi:hypothetical protein